MPHPVDVDEHKNIQLKHKTVERCRNDYIFAFCRKDYCDVSFYNKLKKPSTASPEFKRGFTTLFEDNPKPVVFFLCYDIGDRPEIKTFIRHVICCVAVREKESIYVFAFDMRNMNDIAKGHAQYLERQLKQITDSPLSIHVVNASCLEKPSCHYLQRFKAFEDPGWCMAWALFFLDAVICRPVWKGKHVYELSVAELKHAFARIYRLVDDELKKHGNGFIEQWYELGL